MRFIILVCLLAVTTARRVQIRPRVAEPQIYYEDEDSQAEEEYQPEVYQPRARALPSPRSKDTLNPSKAPPVQTIRNYNKVNDDGSFTFGYEAADGSFKEETRGTDCVVRGKYGYIDPDGNKREFTYVSGNPCDPNAPKEEDEDDVPRKADDDDIAGPANYPAVRPRPLQANYPTRTTTARPATTIFQTEYALDDDEASQELEEEPKVLIRPTTFRSRPRPNYLQVAPVQGESLYTVTPSPATTAATSATPYRLSTPAPRYQTLASPTRHQPTPSYQALESASTPRAIPTHRPQVAITPRPHIAQVAAQYVSPSSTERPGVVYASPRSTTPNPRASPNDIHLNFAAELERYVNTVPVTSRPVKQGIVKSEPIYQSELVYDPSSGQYNTQLYQSLPQTIGDFRLNHKLQPYVAQQQQQQHQHQHQQGLLGLQQIQQASRPVPSRPQQPQEAIYRQQQSEQLLQSQQLYAQQQRRQQQPAVQQKYALQQREQPQQQQQQQQQYYYALAPQTRGQGHGLSVGQIDQFLRGSTAGF